MSDAEFSAFSDTPARPTGHRSADHRPGSESFSLYLRFFYPVSPARVWHALTEGINEWWAHKIHPEARSVLDASVGGHWKQLWNSGGAWFATVSYIDVPNRLRVTGPLAMSRPAINVLDFTLEAIDGGTRLHVQHLCFGEVEPNAAATYEQGWNQLFSSVLAAYLVR